MSTVFYPLATIVHPGAKLYSLTSPFSPPPTVLKSLFIKDEQD